tara:strand:- start:158 stop:325 length:168 start_codon:yes stop_codon:yes gene_type:complete
MKLDKDIAKIAKASMTVDILQNSIKVMNEMRSIEASKKTMKKNVTKMGGNVLSNG